MLGPMTDKPRFQPRANSVALTRFQWWIVGMAFFVAAVGAVLAFAIAAMRSVSVGMRHDV